MASGDGLLTRVRVPGGRLEAGGLEILLALVERWALPVLELTSRGNLQIRGLSGESERELTAALIEHGLAVTPAPAEAARNVLCTAAADLDPLALTDPWPLAQALDQALVQDAALWALPAKFRLLIDGGGVTSLAQQVADIRADAAVTAQGVTYRLALAGTASSARVLGQCAPERVVDAMVKLAHCFLQLKRERAAAELSLDALVQETGLAPFLAAVTPLDRPESIKVAPPGTILGPQPGWFGVALPFGQMDIPSAQALIALARRHSSAQLRVTPWRQVLLPGVPARVAASLQRLGLIVEDGDARLSATACPGSPACHSGSTATREHALRWVRALPQLFDGQLAVHVSGCSKGCARPEASALTLCAEDGAYNLIINDRALPREPANCLLVGLSADAVEDQLHRLAELLTRERRLGESLSEALARLGPASVRKIIAIGPGG